MFGLHCILSTEGDVKLFSFEPIPYLAAICEENIREYAKRGLTLGKVFAFGLTQPSLLTAENSAIFDFYPNYSLVSSSYGYSNEEKDSIASRLKNLSEGKLSQEATRRIVDDSMVAVKIKCPLRTLSAVLDEEIPGTIDLLKIDVEKAEWDVLMGIRDDHWPLIRQVVMETHVVGDSVEMVVQLLQKKGFSKVVVGSDAAVRPPTVKIVKLGDTVGLTASVTVRKINIHLSAEKSQRNPLHLIRNIQKMQPVLPHLDKVLAHSLALDYTPESHTAENIATLLKDVVPDHATRAFIQLFQDITNAIRNSSQRLEHLKRLQKEKMKADKDIMEIINDSNEGVQEWDELPSEVYECFLSLKTGFKTRFNPSSFLLTDAALVPWLQKFELFGTN
ncbi:hypothetical protein EMCRGX_G004187 [Ephydatia muelleri]